MRYCDLDHLRNFFNLVNAEAYGTLIESRLPHLRLKTLNVVWDSHRRQVLAALPILSELVEQSVARRSRDLELYGSRSRRMRLRRVIGATLSEIGVIANDAVQGPLLRLAADDDETVQRVAARALARWREFGREAQLFDTLHRWQTNSRQIEDVLLQDNEVSQRDQIHAQIRATVALAVRYAALYDAPNMLSADLCQLIEQLALDHHPIVRSPFVRYTLPLLVQLHGAGLRDSLRRMTLQRDLMQPVAASLALAYRRNPEEILRTLAMWHNACARQSPGLVKDVAGPREKLLATIALTYGEIQYGDSVGVLTADEAFARLRLILDTEQHPFIRNAVVVAMARQARQQFDMVEPLLRGIMAAVAESERAQIVQILTAIYMEQREQLAGGDGYIERNGHRYSIWFNPEQRPPTAIEQAMTRWVKQPQPVEAQQIATQALVAFVRTLDIAERQRVAQILEERQQNLLVPTTATAPETGPAVVPRPTANIFGGGLVLWLITFGFARTYRTIVRGLLSEVQIQNQVNREALRMVVERWRRAADQEMRTIGAILGRALLFMR